jgi:hypothetical protein
MEVDKCLTASIFIALMMEAVNTSETPGSIYETACTTSQKTSHLLVGGATNHQTDTRIT